MSLLLNHGTIPEGLAVKTLGLGAVEGLVFLGGYVISLEDFLLAAEYVLTNTNLVHQDPRLQFVECVKSMIEDEGLNGPRTKRLRSLVSLNFPNKIRIIAVPPGQAPEEIRKQWIGVTMPLSPEQEPNSIEYRVDPDRAIYELMKESLGRDDVSAALWWADWREHTQEGIGSGFLLFPREVCELIP